MDDGRTGILDVVEPALGGDPPCLRRDDPELEPDRAGAGGHGLTGHVRAELGPAEDVDEVDGLTDLRERRDAPDAEDLVAVARPNRYEAVAVLEEIAHHPVARAGRPRRRAHERDRPRVAEDLRRRSHRQSTSQSQRRVSASDTSTHETNAPAAIIVPGAARFAIAAQIASPIGMSAKLPKKSRLITRARRCSGTSSWSIVSQIAMPNARHAPRTTASADARPNHGESASPAIAKLFTSQSA